MTTTTILSPEDRGRLTRYLRIVRGATGISILLGGVLSPPWEWGDNPVLLFLICLLSLPFLGILWRLRSAPYRDGLVLAGVVGGISAGCVGLLLSVGETSSWSDVALGGLFLTVQGVLVVAAFVTSRLVRGVERAAPRPAPPPPPDIPPADRAAVATRLWVVRGAAIGSLLLAGVPVYHLASTMGPVYAILLFLSLCAPYYKILWRLRAGPRPDGLACALGTGSLFGAGAGMLLLLAWRDGLGWLVAALAAFAAAQGVLVDSAVTLRRRLPTPGGARLLLRGFETPIGWLMLTFFVASTGPTFQVMQGDRDRAAVLAWLRQARTCVADYAARHPAQGYPARLDLLGPQGTHCLTELSPSGEVAGYRIAYTPTAADPGGRIPGYAMTARPSQPDRPGQRNYFLDATGVIYETRENRDAGTGDPRVE